MTLSPESITIPSVFSQGVICSDKARVMEIQKIVKSKKEGISKVRALDFATQIYHCDQLENDENTSQI